jgi:hypothetical protein
LDYLEVQRVQHENVKEYKHIKNCVYQFTSPSGKSYIGVTKNFYRRYTDHKREADRGTKNIFYCACKKYNFYNFKVYILKQDIEDDELLKFAEVLYIEKYKTQDSNYGYNMTPGGDGGCHFGKQNGMYGKNHTPESIQKMKDNIKPNYGHTYNKDRISVYDITGKRYKVYKDDERFLSGELKVKEPRPKILKSEEEKKENGRLGQIKRLQKFAEKSEEELKNINNSKAVYGEKNGRAKQYVIESPNGDKYEVCLDKNLKIFCEEHNLNFNTLVLASKQDNIVKEPKENNACKNNPDYIIARNNTIGWKITKYRRREYEILSR